MYQDRDPACPSVSSSYQVHLDDSVARSGPDRTRETSGGVKGQKHAPTVIHVGKGTAKNECAQQWPAAAEQGRLLYSSYTCPHRSCGDPL